MFRQGLGVGQKLTSPSPTAMGFRSTKRTESTDKSGEGGPVVGENELGNK